MAPAGSALDGHVVGPAAVAAQVDSFEPEAVRAADDGTYVEGAPQVVYQNRELDGLFVRGFAVARFLFQVDVAFEPETGPRAESLVEVNHLRLVLAREAFGFGQIHPAGIRLEFSPCTWHVVSQLQYDDAQEFRHALGLGSLLHC